MQSNCLRLMGKKLLASLAMEGKFCREKLQSLEEDGDMLTVIARVLVTEEGIGESADIIWRQLQTEHHIIVAPTAFDPLPAPLPERTFSGIRTVSAVLKNQTRRPPAQMRSI